MPVYATQGFCEDWWDTCKVPKVESSTETFLFSHGDGWASLMAQWWRIHLPVWETQVQSLGQEDPLEKDMKIHSSILAWEIPWTEEPGGLQSMGSQKSWTRLSNNSNDGGGDDDG